MNFTNIFFGMVSLANLTLFMNRLINDGQYQTVILRYDDVAIRDTNFIQELTDSPNRNYSIVTVRVDKNTDQIFESFSYRNILNGLQIILVGRSSDQYIQFSRDTVFLIRMWPDKLKKQILWNFNKNFAYSPGNMSVIFYETPLSVKHKHGVFKSIEAFVVNSIKIYPDRSVYEIDSERNIHFQLNQTANLATKIYEPRAKTMLSFFEYDGFKNVKNIGNTEIVLADNLNVYMANYITRNVKNMSTWQFLAKKILNEEKNWFDFIQYKPSIEPTYAELFVSSFEDYDSGKFVNA